MKCQKMYTFMNLFVTILELILGVPGIQLKYENFKLKIVLTQKS